ncbi:MAG: DUF2267 domain-containing protein [Deltaproteobacteria bacterium]|nr:DUF2267 domain-containing protein [Deltaproteobacteria bacterium]
MSNQPPTSMEERRRQRSESHASSTYKSFLKDLEAKGLSPEEYAERAATSVLCCLEQRIMGAEAQQLESQLPSRLQELLVRCERHEGLPPSKFGRAEMLRVVSQELNVDVGTAESATRAVLATVSEHISQGELKQVVQQLPKDLKTLFPEMTLH